MALTALGRRPLRHEDWGRANWMSELDYETVYPKDGAEGLVVDLEP